MKAALSATELSRLHRQRRLECSSPIHRVTPINITKRRSRRHSGSTTTSIPHDGAPAGNRDLNGTRPTNSFDEEVMAANSNNGGNTKSPAASLNTPTSTTSNHTRSLSFSSFSLSTETTTMEALKSPPPHTPTNAVTPPDSPGHRSTTSGAYRSMSPRRVSPSPTPSLGTHFDKRPTRRTPNRPGLGGITRSNSSRSMPLTTSTTTAVANTSIIKKSNRSDSNESYESDMPMDELMSVGPPRDNGRPPTRTNRSFDVPLLTDGTSDDSIAFLPASTTSTALVVSSPQNHPNNAFVLKRMTEALQLQTRPPRMSPDEEQLWDVVQQMTKEDVNTSTTTNNDAGNWEQKYKEREAEWSDQQNEHDRALRAIQRVLADVTTEREDTITRLKEELDLSQQQRDDTILKLSHKLKEMQQQANAAKGSDNSEEAEELKSRVDELQEGNAQLQVELDRKDEKVKALESSLQIQEPNADEDLNETLRDLKEVGVKQEQHIGQLEEELTALRSKNEKTASKTQADEDQEDLLKELEEKTSSLENAKMIIASLENANGSLTRELRAKLKEKEEELATLTSTSADRKRTLDSLATELRELQRQQQKPTVSLKQLAKQRALCQMLEKNVKALRQAAVQHEARNDQSSVDRISQIVSETFSSLKQNLESWEAFLKNEAPEASSDAPAGSNPQVEAALAKKNVEVNAMRKELEELKSESSQETEKLQHQVEGLIQQLAANNEALAKKGRELAVLKDSLNLDDTGVGYISDDGTEGYDTESEPVSNAGHFPFSTSEMTKDFSGSLLVHGGPGVGSVNPNAAEMSDATAAEIQMLKNEIVKQQKERESKAAELQAEKESLANAKMIISSLEKANKSMLEDLRSRLQDSNTAIASLLEKSIEHEKTIAMLRKELETCRQDHEKDEQKSNAHTAKLRDENLVFSMRLAAKDREVEELQDTLSQYEGQEVTISKVRMSSVEEKKDDPASDEDN